MGVLSRPYGRQVDPLDLTPSTKSVVWILPLILFAILLFIALRIGALARTSFVYAGLSRSTQTPIPEYSVAEGQPISDGLAAFTLEVRYWTDAIIRWSGSYSLPPTLIALVMQIESCGAPNVRSPAGATGLFQVMPFHFSGEQNPYDPEINASQGLNYLQRSYDLAGGSIAHTLAGYNGGHSLINADPTIWPDETRRYVAWGTGIWEEIQAQERTSKTLEHWLAAGGASLCLQARNSLSIP
jgi:soluble lytic murein transglycosylase-like protein